jgi:hypothetical protein
MVSVCGLLLSVTHQFSPYATGGILVILVLFRQVRPWWTPALVLVPAGVWALIHQTALRGVLDLSMFGRLGNFQPPRTTQVSGLQRLPIVRETVLALVAGIVLLGLLAALNLLLHRSDRRYWALACAPGAGLLVVAINPYGQEGIFRAALFGLPWLALLAAPLFSTAAARVRVGLLATTAGLLATFLVSSFGLDALNVVRTADLAAVRYFQEHGGPRPPTTHYLLTLGTGDLPTTPGLRGGWHQIWGRDRLAYAVGKQPVRSGSAEERLLTTRFVRSTADPSAPPTLFALWSPVSARYGWTYGVQSLQQANMLRDAFIASPYWSVAYSRDGTFLFRYEPGGSAGRRR